MDAGPGTSQFQCEIIIIPISAVFSAGRQSAISVMGPAGLWELKLRNLVVGS